MLAGVWWENLKKRDHMKDLRVDVDIILKYCMSHINRMGWHGPD